VDGVTFDYTGEKRRILALLAGGPKTTAEIQAAFAGEPLQRTVYARLKVLRREGLVQRDYPQGREATWGLARTSRRRRVPRDPRLETLLRRFLAGGVTLRELAAEQPGGYAGLSSAIRQYAYRTGRQAPYREAVRGVHRLTGARRFGKAS
jgi:alpha-D-ribose 1-methylphosphonate 5-triphosphate synthase subunit PhnI